MATGRGQGLLLAYVIDLTNMNIAAELHGKIDPDLLAEQAALPRPLVQHRPHRGRDGRRLRGAGRHLARDGKQGRRPYPKLYRHVQDDRPDFKQNITYGFPITTKTRPQIINALEQAIREDALPHMPMETILECKTFVRRDTLPSPRAADGGNDDRVMALAGALEMYRRYGSHPHDVRTSRKSEEAGVPAGLRLELGGLDGMMLPPDPAMRRRCRCPPGWLPAGAVAPQLPPMDAMSCARRFPPRAGSRG